VRRSAPRRRRNRTTERSFPGLFPITRRPPRRDFCRERPCPALGANDPPLSRDLARLDPTPRPRGGRRRRDIGLRGTRRRRRHRRRWRLDDSRRRRRRRIRLWGCRRGSGRRAGARRKHVGGCEPERHQTGAQQCEFRAARRASQQGSEDRFQSGDLSLSAAEPSATKLAPKFQLAKGAFPASYSAATCAAHSVTASTSRSISRSP
jgi:hypothetical protein